MPSLEIRTGPFCQWARIVCLTGALALGASSQVRVNVRTSQESYLAGEPIHVVLDVANVGVDPVAYSEASGKTDMVISGQKKRQPPILGGCYFMQGGRGGFVGSSFHPPLMKPGESVTFRYLLTDYKLGAGEYILRASGKAGVQWKYYPFNNSPIPPPPPEHKDSDPVEGQFFDQTLRLVIREGSETELRKRFEPYVELARGLKGWEKTSAAREVIAEMAPPFLREVLLEYGNSEQDSRLTVKGLGRINNDESRADLIALYDKSSNLRMRGEIVETLAGIATPKEVTFLASLLPGRPTPTDDWIRFMAAVGVGRIGGSDAVKALVDAGPKMEPAGRHLIAKALGITRDASAVPVLIRMYEGSDDEMRNSVCGALQTLTHYQRCDGSGNVPRQVATWKRWWKRKAAKVSIYGTDACPDNRAHLPMVR